MSFSIVDRKMMSRALALAAKGRYTTSPNPTVGCVIAFGDDIVGEGFTRPFGGNQLRLKRLIRCLKLQIAAFM